MPTERKRGTRRVVGYVVSLSGKRGDWMPGLDGKRWTTEDRFTAFDERKGLRIKYPHAKVFRLVSRFVVLERLRDAVVEAALLAEKAENLRPLLRINHDELDGASLKLSSATRALREHLEKKR